MADLTNEKFTHKYVGARYVSVYDGVYDESKNYESLTIVKIDSETPPKYYISIQPTPAGIPVSNSDFWIEVFAGIQGLKGDAATIEIGNVETLPPGTSAYVLNTGDEYNAVFDFGIEKGDKGDAATIEVGTTTTGAPGTEASVTNSGTSSNAVFDFTIPQGEKGEKGDQGDAYNLTQADKTSIAMIVYSNIANLDEVKF